VEHKLGTFQVPGLNAVVKQGCGQQQLRGCPLWCRLFVVVWYDLFDFEGAAMRLFFILRACAVVKVSLRAFTPLKRACFWLFFLASLKTSSL